jgi:hypothetical protein
MALYDTVMNALSPLITAVGTVVVAGGGLGLIAYGVLKFFGEKWLNAKFEERLAAYRHAQQQELERLKFKINALMDRTTKLHQWEFEVIPEAWSKLADAHATIQAFISPFQQYPDVNRMSGPHLEEFLKDSQLMEWQKVELREAKDKTSYYSKAIFWHRRTSARNSLNQFHLYLIKNGIFIPESLRSNFSQMDDLLWEALREYLFNEEHEIRPRKREKQELLDENGPALLKAIETDVRSRLWSSHANEI